MAKTIQVSVDTSDLKVLNTHLNNTKKTIKMTAKSAKTDFKQLKMSIDPVYRAEKIFTKQVLVAQKAVATGAISNSEYARTFSIIQKNAQASGMTINQFGQVANVNTRKMKRFGAVGMQQVGYQVQDFAVQVQGGTSAMVALGQQGSQLLGIFGPYGAIAGMILAIGTGLAGAFMAAKNAGDDLVSSAKLFKTAMEECS
jgi:Fe2+ or Zn2+ uptake regulation protein